MQLNNTTAQARGRVDSEFRERVRGAAYGRWLTALHKLGAPPSILSGEAVACPECGGRFKAIDQDRGSFACRAAGRADVTGDGFSLVAHLGQITFPQAVRAVGEALGPREIPRRAPRRMREWRGLA